MPLPPDAPIDRPRPSAVMYQEWRHLLFVHWEVPAGPLRALLPAGLELDTFEGRAYVGLVPFTMRGVRPRGLPSVSWFSNFHETNVRTYVRRPGGASGVWFFSLDAANPVAVAIARVAFGLPYFHARMSLEVDDRAGTGTGSEAGPTLVYASERLRCGPTPPRSEVRARATGPIETAAPGSLDHFLVERYDLYSVRRGRLLRGRVRHDPYPIRRAEVVGLDETLLLAAGIARPDAEPRVHYVSGVVVDVLGLSPA